MSQNVKIKNVKGALSAALKLLEESADFKLNDLGEFARKRIQAETRKGQDLKNESEQPPLSAGYISQRERMRKGVDTRFFRPSFSNLTLTGQMLKSLYFKVYPRNRIIEVGVEGVRKDGLTNSAVAKDLASRGRYFLGLDRKGIYLIRKIVLDEIRRRIKKRS